MDAYVLVPTGERKERQQEQHNTAKVQEAVSSSLVQAFPNGYSGSDLSPPRKAQHRRSIQLLSLCPEPVHRR